MADPATEATRQGPDPAADSEGLSTVAATLKQTAPILASYALPFLLIVYLAFNGGGYGVVVRSEIGIVAWWIVLVGSLCSVLPVSRPTRQAAIALALLAGLLFWTAFALIWTDSIGRTVLELSRIAALLGVLTLVVFASGRDSLRRTLAGAAAAIAVVALVAVLSRLQPGWFPEVSASRLLPGADYRLYYPLGYWNGLAALMAIGLPLSLWMATRARWIWTRSVAAASVPVLCLVVYYTFSRGGILAAIAGLLAFVLLSPGRLSMLPALVPAAIGSAIILAGAEQRSELADSTIGSTIGSTTDQGGELTLILLVVCFGVGLLQAGVALSERNGLLPQLRISGRAATVGATAALALLAVLAVALNAPGRTGDAWSEFRDNSGDLSGQSRLTSSAGNSRYQYWQASMEAFEQHPLVGQGPGTFEIWWAKNGTVRSFVRQAHSLYLQMLAEYGIVGLALLLALFGMILATGATQSLKGRSEERRSLAAAATGGFFAFAVSAIYDWSWEMTVLPITALLLGAVVLGPDARSRHGRRSRFATYRLGTPILAGLAAVSIACLAILVSLLAGSKLVNDSRSAFRDGETNLALKRTRQAADLQPYATEPLIQEALILGYTGRPRPALGAAREATRLEPNDWRPWLVRTQMAASADATREAVRSFRMFRSLNPRSSLAK